MSKTDGDCKTIFVIEDDYDVRESIAEALQCEGYSVRTAANGLEGLNLLKNSPKPCLVLLDMMMPVMNGREFLDTLLEDKTLPEVPVLVVSAVADRSDLRGATGYLRKPADLDVMLDFIGLYCPGNL